MAERADATRNRTAVLVAAQALFAREDIDRVTLRDAAIIGPPPLGPGGPPGLALHAFIDALFDFVLDNRTLIRALEHRRHNAYYANPASQFWIGELSRRVHAVQSGADAGYLAHAVFTAMRADVIDYLRIEEKMGTERIRAGLHTLVPATTAAGT